MDFIDIAGKLGVPVAVMAVMALFFWRVAIWFKPRADQMIDAHLGMIASIRKNGDENTKNIKSLAEQSVCKFDPAKHCMIVKDKDA